MIYANIPQQNNQKNNYYQKYFTAREVEDITIGLLEKLQNASKTLGSDLKISIIPKVECHGVDVRLERDNKAIKISTGNID